MKISHEILGAPFWKIFSKIRKGVFRKWKCNFRQRRCNAGFWLNYWNGVSKKRGHVVVSTFSGKYRSQSGAGYSDCGGRAQRLVPRSQDVIRMGSRRAGLLVQKPPLLSAGFGSPPWPGAPLADHSRLPRRCRWRSWAAGSTYLFLFFARTSFVSVFWAAKFFRCPRFALFCMDFLRTRGFPMRGVQLLASWQRLLAIWRLPICSRRQITRHEGRSEWDAFSFLEIR